MNETCREVLDQIELYAAGECAEPGRTVVSRHLATCPSCAQSEREALLLLGLLDARCQEAERLQRLHARLENEGRPVARRRFLPLARRAAAVAALVMLAFGLTLGFRAFRPADDAFSLEIALGRGPARLAQPAPAIDPAAEKLHAMAVPLVYTLDMKGKTVAEYRRELQKSVSRGRPPAPPRVDLHLELRNRGHRELRILVGVEASELTLNLTGPGVLISKAQDDLDAAFLVPKTVRLAPGRTAWLPIERLVFGSRGSIQYAYWTEPGEYALSIRYRAAVATAAGNDAAARLVMVQSAPIRIQVLAAR